jgi:hypothetical protein
MEYSDDPIAKKYMQHYLKAKALRENWVPLFEECYEYALPQRESFYYEEAGQRGVMTKSLTKLRSSVSKNLQAAFNMAWFLTLLGGLTLFLALRFLPKSEMPLITNLMK